MTITPTVAPGTILISSWGYDQTNIDFFEVTRTSAHNIWVRPLASHSTSSPTDMSETVLPSPGKYIGPEFRRKPLAGAADITIAIDSVAIARRWEGTEAYQTHYA